MPGRPVTVFVLEVEAQPHASQMFIGLEMRRHHHLQGLGLEDGAVLIGAAIHQRLEVQAHFVDARVSCAGSLSGEDGMLSRFEPAFDILIALRQVVPDAFAEIEVGLEHAQRFEDVFEHIAGKTLPAEVSHKLTQRGVGIVGVSPLLLGVNIRSQHAAVVFSQGGQGVIGFVARAILLEHQRLEEVLVIA